MPFKSYLALLITGMMQLATFAQERDSTTLDDPYRGKPVLAYSGGKKGVVYTSWGGDGPLLSFAGNVKHNGDHLVNIPRFTVFVNIGANFNYDLNRYFGLFTGINIKNIGLITKENDSLKLKRRVYTLGVPLGFKIGDVGKGRIFFFAGGSYDLAFNYK